MVRYDDIHSQCFKDTVFVYREIRKGGQLHVPAFVVELEAYNRTRMKRIVQAAKCEYIAFVASIAPNNFWFGAYNEGQITNR